MDTMPNHLQTVLVLVASSLLPALALAGGNHGGGHAASGHAPNAGMPGHPADVARTITVTMDDSMRFIPDNFSVKAGETIRFLVQNTGSLQHEMVLGSTADLKAHAEMMRKFPGMEHDEPNMVTLEPGAQGSVVWKFDQPGTVDFACLVPGHMEAGMVGKVSVTGHMLTTRENKGLVQGGRHDEVHK
jgi:uncharacterized cupredoxin-like copper-binding protein